MSAIFDNSKHSRDNPFLESPVQQSFYHPSVAQPVDDTMKQATLSVERKSWEVSGDLSPTDDHFLKASLYYTSKFRGSDGGGSSKFNESWPDSEKPSSLSVSGNASFSGELYSAQSQVWTSSPMSMLEKDALRDKRHLDHVPERDLPGGLSFSHGTDESVLFKYIDRFRHGTPLSREQREREGIVKSQDFWWLSAENVRGSYDGLKSRHLEEKAEKLLQRTVSSLGSSEPIVSTDGLGSSLSVTPRSLHEEPYRPVFTRTAVTEKASSRPLPWHRAPPADDILAQWRLRCKMEEARQTASYRQTEPHRQTTSQSKPGSFNAKSPLLDDSTDSRLAEFRRRLASGRLLDATAMTSDRSPSVQELEKHMSGAAMDIDRVPHGTAFGTASTVPLASPSVPPGTRLTQQGEREDVVPHLHLSCDILQCSHEHQHARQQQDGDTWRQRQSDRTHMHVFDDSQTHEDDDVPHPTERLASNIDTQCAAGPCHRGSGDHSDHSGNVGERGRVGTDDHSESNNCTDRSIDNTGRLKHRSTPVNLHKDVSYHKDSGADRLMQLDGSGDVSGRVDRSGELTRLVDGRQNITRRGRRRQTVPERDGHVGVACGGDVTYSEENTSSTQKKKQKDSSRVLAGDRHVQIQGFDTTTDDGAGLTRDTRRPASKKTATRRPDREALTDEDGMRRSTHSDTSDGRRKSGKTSRHTSQSHPARSHSSPTRSVTSAIGQVVGSQLFGSSASLTSSIDSSCDLARPVSPVTSPADLASALCSDSEEFADDEVLVELRNRRAAYLQRLASVNRALERIT